ncbi:MAG: aminomethyl-transferring glycine dehydrogenase subunit GcvPA [Firmicutes bacterium]|nr:aminomethyl-transferring glycine dehydrogenase subunit GcvPA [Bacillota bacterium]
MSNYLSVTDEEKKQMLESIGVKTADELFADINKDLWLRKLNMPDGKSQQEVMEIMSDLAAKNKVYRSIMRGAGAYWHYTPSAVKNLAGRSEFVTGYTPYQAELSQGVLQSIFEYQSMICQLTGMDVSNASVFSGATAAAEGILMCEGQRKKVLVPDNINPETTAVIKTYLSRKGMEIIPLPVVDGLVNYDALRGMVNQEIACIYFEQPNYFGLIEDAEEIVRIVHDCGGKVVTGCNPLSLALLKSPGECGADIAVGDAGCFGLPLSFGGPYIGFMACTAKEMRRLPGRIVGETLDKNGKRAYVLTLQAREQHIRREKASSNICTNQAHCALTAGIYLAAMGPNGLKEVSTSCTSMAHYAAEEMVKVGATLKYSEIQNGDVIKGEFFHEFVTVHKGKAAKIIERLAKDDILAGLELDKNEILWCFTEMVKKEDVDAAIEAVRRG